MSIQPFEFPETGQPVRSVSISGEPWFVAADVATVLELGNPRSSLALLDDDEKGVHSMDTLGGRQEATIVNEPGLYSLILRSRKPQARAFRRWITHEVIPSIRRTGRYEAAPQEMTKLEALRAAIESEEGRLAAEARAVEAERQVRELEPAAHAWDVLASADGDWSLRDAAFILNRDAGIRTGQNRLKASLRDLGMIDRWGTPYSKHGSHLTERPQTFRHPETGEETQAKPQIRVTAAGLRYLHRRLGGIAPLRLDQVQFNEAG